MAKANNQTMSVARGRKTRSKVWKHFTRFTDDNDKDKARCMRCHAVLGAGTGNGTSSLWGHLKICEAGESGASAREAPSSSGVSSDSSDPGNAAASVELARMIALHGYDPSVVEDDYFRSFVRLLNPGFEVPKRVTIERLCDVLFDNAREVPSYMPSQDPPLYIPDHAPGRVALAVGKAKVMEGEVLYTACHLIDNQWKLQKLITEAYMVVPSHVYHGPLLGVMELADFNRPVLYKESIQNILWNVQSHGMQEILFMMAWMITEDDVRLQVKDCIEKKFSDTYAVKRQLFCTTYMDHVFHSIAGCFLIDTEFNLHMSFEVQGLDLTRKTRQQLLSHLGLDHLWAYNQYWYSCYCSLQVLHKKDSSRASNFTKLLCRIWGEIDRSIQRIYVPSCPTSNLCLIELFRVRKILQFELERDDGDNCTNGTNGFQGGKDAFYNGTNGFQDGRAVADVLHEATDTLDKAIQDSYLVWSIPLVLDPRHKLKFIDFCFKGAFGLEAAAYYTSQVERKINEMYTDYAQEDDGALAMDIGSRADPLQQAWDEQDGLTELENNLEAKMELDHYLKDPLEVPTDGFDILQWWKANRLKYPTMARIARDALAMPTCNMLSSEQFAHVRSIIRGYSTVHYYRHFR